MQPVGGLSPWAPEDVLTRTAERWRHSSAARLAARGGLLSRAVLYLVLAYLAGAVAWGRGSGRSGTQANANGALTEVAAQPAGRLVLGLAGLGFLSFGLMRLAGAYGDTSVRGLRRITTAGQAVFYLGMGFATAAFLAGDSGTGSSQQQDSTAMLLVSSPAGRVLLLAAGATVVIVCLWQLRLAVQGGFADSLPLPGAGGLLHATARTIARVGIVARALAVLPLGALMIVAAVRSQAGTARDLDQLLDALNRDPVGHVLVWLVAAGFFVFALYSLVETRYREVHAGN